MENINIKKILDYFKSGKLEIAKKETTLLIKKFPNNYFLYNLFGAILAGQKKLDEAVIYFEKSIQISPNYADTYNNLAGVLADQKKYDKITVLSVAPLLGEAIKRIHEGMSVGELFEQVK